MMSKNVGYVDGAEQLLIDNFQCHYFATFENLLQ